MHGVSVLAIGYGSFHSWIHYPKDLKSCRPVLAWLYVFALRLCTLVSKRWSVFTIWGVLRSLLPVLDLRSRMHREPFYNSGSCECFLICQRCGRGLVSSHGYHCWWCYFANASCPSLWFVSSGISKTWINWMFIHCVKQTEKVQLNASKKPTLTVGWKQDISSRLHY